MAREPAHKPPRLNLIGDVVRCPRCGATYDSSYTVCLADGAKLVAEEGPEQPRRASIFPAVAMVGLPLILIGAAAAFWMVRTFGFPTDGEAAHPTEEGRPAKGLVAPPPPPAAIDPGRASVEDASPVSPKVDAPPSPPPSRPTASPSVPAPEALGVRKSDLKDPFGDP
ncbi:MAG: hypothetical protein AAGA48_32960 [Myxococcota bacterium]